MIAISGRLPSVSAIVATVPAEPMPGTDTTVGADSNSPPSKIEPTVLAVIVANPICAGRGSKSRKFDIGPLVIEPCRGAPPEVVPNGAPPSPAPERLAVTTVCITFAVSEPDEPAPPIDSVTEPSEPLGSGEPLLVTIAPMMAPTEASGNATVALVMPVARFGSNGDGTTTATGAVG